MKDTFVTTGYGRIGLSGDYGGTWLLANLTNISIAKEMYFLVEKWVLKSAISSGFSMTYLKKMCSKRG